MSVYLSKPVIPDAKIKSFASTFMTKTGAWRSTRPVGMKRRLVYKAAVRRLI
jgi:hypothetical protein